MSVLTAYQRFRFLWGAVDWQGGSGSPYTTAQTGTTLGTSAAAGVGVGVRRALLVYARDSLETGLDPAESHFDFLNITGGDPDDTWTSGDYSALETLITNWWVAIRGSHDNTIFLEEIRWYRYGPGINPPNPAERVTTVHAAGTSSAQNLPPQVTSTVSFRNAVRRSWGRTYVPSPTAGALSSIGSFSNTYVDLLCNSTATLVAAAVAADFPLVVVSKHLNAVLNVEALAVDDIPDIQRRRRFQDPLYRKVVNT